MPSLVYSDPLSNDATAVLGNAGARAAHDRNENCAQPVVTQPCRVSTRRELPGPGGVGGRWCRAFGFEVRIRVEGDDGGIVHSELTYGASDPEGHLWWFVQRLRDPPQ
jgi:hypothetical protein